MEQGYEAADDVTSEGTINGLNQYLYDAEGRICAVYSSPVLGVPSMTGYLYDADGTRVAKGSISAWSCDPTANGFTTTNDYILGLGGEQLTEMGMGGTTASDTTTTGLVWQHANIWAGGKLLGTYDKDGLHFYLDDPLGTRRAQTDAAGVLEQTCSSLPFGDGLACSGGDLLAPTENHFTGKERDTESGNDYFMARYYSSAMGRFMSPDWSAKVMPVPYAKLGDPQSLNLYAYVRNNPLGSVDADGHETETYLGVPGYEAQQENNNGISPTEWKIWGGVGLGVAALSGGPEIGAALRGAWVAATSFCLMNCAQLAPHVADAIAPPGSPSFSFSTLGSLSRLSSAEFSTGERLAAQGGLHLSESSHIGAEFVDQAGKTYDAMGQPAAYAHWNAGQFFNSIGNHLNKSVDFVAIDLKGASKDQIGSIKTFVGGLAKEAQARIKYVQ